MSDWRETDLWKEIKKRSAATLIQQVLGNYMPAIQSTLSAGGTASPDFTLHDADHGFRVAQMMARLLCSNRLEGLSNLEVALLLLSAYCHDIGMTPNRRLSESHFGYLMTGDGDLLTPTEIIDLQEWLDSEWGGLTAPIVRGNPTVEDLAKLYEIHAYYSRHKHNDWSELWIRENLAEMQPQLYGGWIDDIITLCRSHHDGLAELRSARFDARLAGSPAEVVNLRFLAAVLRVADVLEFDPERTPEVILHHRDIKPKSRIFWYKDHSIAFELTDDASRVILSARTPNAAIHKAVLMTADWVDVELATCAALEHEGAFRRGAIPEVRRSAYSWPWPARLTQDISEVDSSFEYIEGAFRPSTERILSILSGEALYGHPISAVRELIQNATDAIYEQIAYERLQKDNPSDSMLEDALSNLHKVRISVFEEHDRMWLRCSDDGAGMTKSIIEKHLLVSGSDKRPEIRALERDAQSKGFELGGTGQFGIGVLRYFMIADKLEIITKRSQEAGGSEGSAWRFITDGLGSFGSLGRINRSAKGTDVVLRIKRDYLDSFSGNWVEDLIKYIRSTVRYLPCILEIIDERNPGRVIRLGPRWTSTLDDFEDEALSLFASSGRGTDDLKSAAQLEASEHEKQQWDDVQSEARRKLKWFGPTEFPLPSGGLARIWLPYFELDGGGSAYFMRSLPEKLRKFPDKREALPPTVGRHTSWRGFSVDGRRSQRSGVVVEVNLIRGNNIGVDRKALTGAENFEDAAEITRNISTMWKRFLVEHRESDYHLLNIVASPVYSYPERDSEYMWKVIFDNGDTPWKSIKFPCIDVFGPGYYGDEIRRGITVHGSEVEIFGRVSSNGSGSDYFISSILGGGELLVASSGTGGTEVPVVCWRSPEQIVRLDGSVGPLSSRFPPEFSDIYAVSTEDRVFLNSNHHLVKALDRSAKFRYNKISAQNVDEVIGEALSSKASALEFMASSAREDYEFWAAIRDRSPEFLKTLWGRAELEQDAIVRIWHAHGMFKDNLVISISPSECSVVQTDVAEKTRGLRIDDVTPAWSAKLSPAFPGWALE